MTDDAAVQVVVHDGIDIEVVESQSEVGEIVVPGANVPLETELAVLEVGMGGEADGVPFGPGVYGEVAGALMVEGQVPHQNLRVDGGRSGSSGALGSEIQATFGRHAGGLQFGNAG